MKTSMKHKPPTKPKARRGPRVKVRLWVGTIQGSRVVVSYRRDKGELMVRGRYHRRGVVIPIRQLAAAGFVGGPKELEECLLTARDMVREEGQVFLFGGAQ